MEEQKTILVPQQTPLSLQNTSENFHAGKVMLCFEKWKKLTSDYTVLQTIKGVKIDTRDIYELPPPRKEITFNSVEKDEVTLEIAQFLKKGIIKSVNLHDNKFLNGSCISNIFLRQKPDGSNRMILNLKHFNEMVDKKHFKMDTLNSVLPLMKRNCFLAKLDLKDAYYSIPIHSEDRKFFRFYFDGILYEFCALPQGYTDSPRLFTKTLKVPLARLRSLGYTNSGYLDDIYLQGDSFEDCLDNITHTASLLDSLGFTINQSKSIFIPSKRMEFLGFVLDSSSMLIYPNEKKVLKIKDLCSKVLNVTYLSIQQLAELIGHLVSVSSGNQYAPIFYKRLEILKNKALKQSKHNYKATVSLTDEVKKDIQWWINCVD